MAPQPGEMTQAEYARHRGVSRQAIGKLVDGGKIPFRVDEDGTKYIDPAAADLALGESRERVDADDDAGDVGGSRSAPAAPSLTKAKTATEIYRARIAELQYQKLRRELVPVAQVEEAARQCGDVLATLVRQLSSRAEEIGGAYVANGVAGARAVIKGIERELAEKASAAFRALAADALAGEAGDEEGEAA
jgi:hypothetical protein